MATVLANSTSLPPVPPPLPRAGNSETHASEQIIRRQLGRAGSHVKWIEAGSQMLTLLIGTLVFFLLAALVDHWIMPLGWFGRWLLLVTYLGGCGWFLAKRVLPIVLRAVNPAYSARAIEEATPSLKNSLINFLFLKQDHSGVKQSVLDAMQQRAATDISNIEVETTIDRTPLIRLGYVMCGVMALVAVYKIVSPKDPFQTVARVVAPWADLARPSRVVIREVLPGHASVYLGSLVEVSAEIQGVRGGDEVRLVYSSADGQVLDRALVMKAAEGTRRYIANLPAEDDSSQARPRRGGNGLQQGVQYHIQAGDALSSIYEIRVRMAPTIAVEKAELQFPAYTRKPMQTQATGEISALEGTRVTIRARANQPIKTAFLEFDPRTGGAAETLPLNVDGQDASGTFTLQLTPDRTTPWRETYQVRFTNEQGEISEQPVIHKLQVQADLPPEVQILAPLQSRVDVPEDGALTIEVRGVDPDFSLTQLLVTGKNKDQPVFQQSLLPAGELPSQATGKFEFRPSELKLKAGTVVTYQGVAIDNRHDPRSGQLQPGRVETSEYSIQIVAARRRDPNNGGGQASDPPNANNQPTNDQQQPNPGENRPQPNGGDKQPRANEDKSNENKPGENKENQPGNPMNGEQSKKPKGQDEQPKEGEQEGEGKSGKGEQGDNQQGKGESGESGKGQGNKSESGKGQEGKGQEGEGQQGQEGQGGKSSEKSPMGGQAQQPNGGQGQDNQQEDNQNSPGNDGTSTQARGGQSGGMGTSQAADPNGQRTQSGQGGPQGAKGGAGEAGKNSDQNSNDPGQGTGASGQGSGRQGSGANQKPEHDGQKFEEMLKHLREKAQENQEQGQGGQETGATPNNDRSSKPNSQPSGQGSGKQPAGANQQPAGDQTGARKDDNRAVTAEELDKLREKFGNDAVDQAERQAKENQNAEKQPGGEKPGGNEPGDKPEGSPNGSPMPGQNGQSGSEAAKGQPQGGKQPGAPQNGANQKSNDGQSGSPQGPPPQGKGEKPTPAEGEQKNPGAGQNGESGAGGQSKDKTGSGTGQEQNRDVKKEMKSDNDAPETGDPSAPSTSKKQSNSEGSTSGDQSGGGKQGAGQSGGQQGNDSAGGSSPGDEGAGAAKEQGKGPTGSKGGQGQEAAGKTGVSGNKQGEGSETRGSKQGSEPGQGEQKEKRPGDKSGTQPGGTKSGGSELGQGAPTGGGTAADRSGQGITNKSDDVADAVNEAYTRKATDLVLQQLREQEHNPDPELANKMQMTPQELQEFARRWNQMKKDAESDPNKARELDEAFRSLGLRDPKAKRRAGGAMNDKQRDLRDAGGRSQAPSKYRQQFDQFRKTNGN